MRCIYLVFISAVCLLVGACSSGMKAGLLTLQQEVMPTHQDVRSTTLRPGVRYLLVEEQGREGCWFGSEMKKTLSGRPVSG